MIHVIIVDDEILTRLGIETFLRDRKDIHISGEFASAEEALDFMKKNGKVDCIVTDIEMSGINGIELIRRIRSEYLSDGIVILSCHAEFKYAQEALAAGADAYLLKQEINEAVLADAIQKAVQKNHKSGNSSLHAGTGSFPDETTEEQNGTYMIAAIQLRTFDTNEEHWTSVDEGMLERLVDNITGHYSEATLITPYKDEMFILFRFPTDYDNEQRVFRICELQSDLDATLSLYISRRVVLGVSDCFNRLAEVRRQYRNAITAAQQTFYDDKPAIYYCSEPRTDQPMPELTFSSDDFLDEGGVDRFIAELDEYLSACRMAGIPMMLFRENLISQIEIFIYKVLQEYRYSQGVIHQWSDRAVYFSIINQADGWKELREKLRTFIKEFQTTLLSQLRSNEFDQTLQYIEHHYGDRLQLQELAAMSCMSTTSFCRKFKEQTGTTLVHYINTRKIEQVQADLDRGEDNLDQIADNAGFSNVNYMVRVFKKITGTTITEYRQNRH